METFKFIHRQQCGSNLTADIGQFLEESYDQNTIQRKFVVQDSTLMVYHVFSDYNEFRAYMLVLPESRRTFHEVIFGFTPQRLKFDIDADSETLGQLGIPPAEGIKYVINHVVDAILSTYYTTFGEDLLPDDIIYCRSMHPDEDKYSYHIILKKAVPSHESAKLFTDYVLSMLPATLHRYLDPGVNKSIQCFRLAGCCKQGSKRVKTILSPGAQFEDTLITHTVGCQMLPAIHVDDQTSEIMNSDDIEQALHISRCVHEQAFKFRKESRGMLIFDRIKASYCELCAREHTKDNTLVVTLFRSGSTVRVFYKCRRDETKTSVQLGEFISSVVGGAEGAAATSAGTYLERVVAKPAPVRKTLFETLARQNVYSEPRLRPFEPAHTLCVHAAMKMGKTKALLDHLATYSSQLLPPIIRFISFRQTFSMNIKEKFADFALYSDTKGVLNQPKLIIQVESLHRLQIGDAPDLLIMDECESIFEQFDSGLLRNFNGAFAVFQWLMRYSKRVICMDAGLSDRSFNILQKMRPGFLEGGLYHHNEYQNATGDVYNLTTYKEKWFTKLYEELDANKRVAIPISSLTEAKVLSVDLRKRYPAKCVKLYSSETLAAERKQHFGDVNTYWRQYDILLYTPTVSAGVSFEQAHFDVMFGYFTDASCPVETCLQMMGRIRDIREKTYYIHLDAHGASLPTTVAELTRLVYMSRENLQRSLGDTLAYEYGPDGQIHFYNTDYFTIYVENMRVRNLSKNMFIKRFTEAVKITGATVQTLVTVARPDVLSEHSMIRDGIRQETNRELSQAVELTHEEYVATCSSIAAGDNVSREMVVGCQLHKLRTDYNYYGPVTPNFVDTYMPKYVRRWYKNLTRLNYHQSLDASLETIRTEELSAFGRAIESEDTKNADLNRRYVYDQHRVAIMFLRACGWKTPRDRHYIAKAVVENNLRTAESALLRELDITYYYFEAQRVPRLDLNALRQDPSCVNNRYVETWMHLIMRILYIMYGCRIRHDKPTNMYMMTPCGLFTYERADTTKPLIYGVIID